LTRGAHLVSQSSTSWRAFRFDMSEYQTQESLGVLLGARVGEVGLLGMARAKSATGTVLFDEIEKAHPRVLDLFLQILDAARVTMASGETLDLSGFYIVFTSNIAATEIINLQHSSFATIERHVLAKAQQSLRPELYARIAEKLVFNRLSYEVQMEIARLHIGRRTFISSRQRVSPDGRPRSCLVPDATRFSSTIGSASVARHD
jgi:ATP-dependent Clp protease ATP-binding subunit ClpB